MHSSCCDTLGRIGTFRPRIFTPCRHYSQQKGVNTYKRLQTGPVCKRRSRRTANTNTQTHTQTRLQTFANTRAKLKPPLGADMDPVSRHIYSAVLGLSRKTSARWLESPEDALRGLRGDGLIPPLATSGCTSPKAGAKSAPCPAPHPRPRDPSPRSPNA